MATPPSAGELASEITWGEVFAVLPFGNRTVIETLTGAQLSDGTAQRPHAGVRSGIRRGHRPLPAGVRAEDQLHVHASPPQAGSTPVVDRDVARRPTAPPAR